MESKTQSSPLDDLTKAEIQAGDSEKLNEPKEPKINVDELLESVVYPCGLWQWGIAVLLMLSCTSLTTFPVYANNASPHRCRMEEPVEQFIAQNHIPFEQVSSHIGPWSNSTGLLANKTSKHTYGCQRYNINWLNASLEDIFFHSNYSDSLQLDETESCPLGYVHEDSPFHYPENVVKEFETVCSKSWLVPLGTSLYVGGMAIGFVIGGWGGGRFGRKWTMIFFAVVEFVSGIWTSLSPNYTSYILGRLMMSVGCTAKYGVAWVYMIEMTVARYRSMFRALLTIGLAFFYRGLMALEAYLIPNWRWLNIAVTGPNILSILYIFLPESPRWLISQNRLMDAINVMKSGYRVNHLHKQNGNLDKLDALAEEVREWETKSDANTPLVEKNKSSEAEVKHVAVKYDFKSIFLGTVAMLGTSVCFMGLLFYARIVKNYVYIVGFLNAVMMVPSNLLFFLLYRYTPRRKLPLMVFCVMAILLLAGISMYVLIALPSTDTALTVCSNISLILINVALIMLFLYIPELFASNIRTQMAGLIFGLARLGTMVCTFVNELDSFAGHGMPLVVYCITMCVVLLSLVFLRDTTGKNLPDK